MLNPTRYYSAAAAARYLECDTRTFKAHASRLHIRVKQGAFSTGKPRMMYCGNDIAKMMQIL